MSKIFLVKCSQSAGILTTCTFPLGLMYLASTLRQQDDGYEIEIYDMRVRGEDFADLKEAVCRFKPDMVGLSAITWEAPNMYRAAKTVRQTGFSGPLIAGGPHPTVFPQESLACEDIDYLVIGEGERTFTELVETLFSRKDPRTVPGIAYRENGHVRHSPPRPYIENLEEEPLPAWDLVDIGEYSRFRSMGVRCGRYMNIFTSRACPFRCIYCHSLFGKGFRARSPRSVLEEIKILVDRHDVRHFEIVDDIFNCDLDRAKKIFDLLHQEGIPAELSFSNGLRCDRLDREFLEKLSRFRTAIIAVAVETASRRLQRMIRKNLDLARVTEMINICADLGIYTRGYFMLGFPTETEEELRATVDFAVRSKLHAAMFFAVIPFKGTELYDMCIQQMKNTNYKYEDHDYFRSPLNLSEVPDEIMFKIQRWAYVRFAMKPSRVYRLLRDFPDRKLLWTAIKAWMEFFTGAGKGHRPGKPVLVPGASRPGWRH